MKEQHVGSGEFLVDAPAMERKMNKEDQKLRAEAWAKTKGWLEDVGMAVLVSSVIFCTGAAIIYGGIRLALKIEDSFGVVGIVASVLFLLLFASVLASTREARKAAREARGG